MIWEVHLPQGLDELWEYLSMTPDATLYAGGTDLLVRLRKGLCQPSSLICLERVQELKGVQDHGDSVFIGACTTHASLLAHPNIHRNFPVLAHALRVLGSPQIRNMGTLGGNIMTASPAGDTLPALYLLGAEVELREKQASRRVPIGCFIRGPGLTELGSGEILSGVWIPKQGTFTIEHYEKVGQRKALAIAVVSLAARIRISQEGIIEGARLAWGSVGPTVVMAPDVEEFLKGRTLTAEVLTEAGRLAREVVSPIDDIRAGAGYRRQVEGNLLFRLLNYSSLKDW
jgi:CO/xanthine dehydrogenase FAD-binding subunit